jgi:Na+-transporting methylmalonyl-CoA/oxaloacetate decarboxylase gamma subunit
MQTNKEAFFEVMKGTSFVFLILGTFCVFIYGMGGIADQQESGKKPEDRFKVVDQYGPCEVVRYAPKNGGNYAYFLDCK